MLKSETFTTATLIDHIATTNKSNIVTLRIYKSCLSDHYLVYLVRSIVDFVVLANTKIKIFLQGK